MTAFNVILLLINLIIVSGSFFLFKYKFDNRYLNRDILNEVKKEINNLIVNLNETTIKSVSISENKIMILKELLKQSDIKMSQLEDRLKNFEKKELRTKGIIKNQIENESENIVTYTPQQIAKSTIINTELNNVLKLKSDFEDKLEETQLEKLTITDKIIYLNERGLSRDAIRKKLSLDPGEFDFLVNIENINLKF